MTDTDATPPGRENPAKWRKARPRAVASERGGLTRFVVGDAGAEFVSRSGQLLARLDALAGKGAALTLYDAAGHDSLFLSAVPGHAQITVGARAGGAVRLQSLRDLGGALGVSDRHHQEVARVCCGPEGGRAIVRGPDGSDQVSLDAGPQGGLVAVSSADGAPRAGLMSCATGGRMSVVSPAGHLRAVLGVDDGDGALSIYDRRGVTSFVVPVSKILRPPARSAGGPAPPPAAPPTRPRPPVGRAPDGPA